MLSALPALSTLGSRLKIVHQTGEADLELVRSGYSTAGFSAEVTPFIGDMASAYAGADLIVCRAGATTIAETTACGKACLFIPYPHAVDDHQRRNAEELLTAGACTMLLEQELTGDRLAKEICGLFNNLPSLESMGKAARQLGRIDAARIIVDAIATRIGELHVR
jgi:UDP-N-acetylglucosamine--N-acetylmuramyl-(pentapeptide) pyrophosphoryl-undecaprenol N-acetylglucosamine transferase